MNDQKIYRTDFLTANSFKIGLGSVFNVAGNYFEYNNCESSEEADGLALSMDFHIVGQDINDSVAIFERENTKQLELQF